MMRLKSLPGFLGAFLFAVTVQAANRQWVHVHVNDTAKEEKVKINIPLSLVETMLPLIKEKSVERGRIRLQDKDLKVEDLRKIWREVRDAGDMEFISVENKDTNLKVMIQGKYLLVQPEEKSKSKVNIKLPLAVVDAMLSGDADELNLTAAVKALRDSGVQDIVTVEDRYTTVRVWIDDSNLGK